MYNVDDDDVVSPDVRKRVSKGEIVLLIGRHKCKGFYLVVSKTMVGYIYVSTFRSIFGENMSQRKKEIRRRFRDAVFKRDNNLCKVCSGPHPLDAHHITDRNLMPNGGYVVKNGISLCATCHELAEVFHEIGEAYPGFSPEELYKMIGSSYDEAYVESLTLKD